MGSCASCGSHSVNEAAQAQAPVQSVASTPGKSTTAKDNLSSNQIGKDTKVNSQNADGSNQIDTNVAVEIPNEFLCPISCDIMNDPVIATDGHTYERSEITTWFRSHTKSPKTNETLGDLRLIPNYALKNLIADFRAKNPMYARVEAPVQPPSLVRSVSDGISNLGAVFIGHSPGNAAAAQSAQQPPLPPPPSRGFFSFFGGQDPVNRTVQTPTNSTAGIRQPPPPPPPTQPQFIPPRAFSGSMQNGAQLQAVGGGGAPLAAGGGGAGSGVGGGINGGISGSGPRAPISELERQLLEDTRASGATDNIGLVERYIKLRSAGTPQHEGGDRRALPTYFTVPFILELSEVVKGHPNITLRRTILGSMSSYTSVLDPSLSQVDRYRTREVVLNSLMHCGRTDTDVNNRVEALDAVFKVFSELLPQKIHEVAGYYLERLQIESQQPAGAFGALISLFSAPSADIVCACIRNLSRTDDRMSPQIEARPEYHAFLNSNTSQIKQEAADALLRYRSIPEDYGEIVLQELTGGRAVTKETCVHVLFRHGRNLRTVYPRIVAGLVQTVESRRDLSLQWMILENIGAAFRDPHPLIINILITKLASTEKGFLWWNTLSKAPAKSVLGLAGQRFPEETLAVIRERKDFLVNLLDHMPASSDRDVMRAVCVLLRKVDPTIEVPGPVANNPCTIM